ncbi:hypothetical protein EYF80_025514 [Liparis tanakae]|uniref:Uncharacterized protein n=1 Tax=Liparis tanakae TaxID=230148 RepID=A0A4Z2HH28_9TELE|nr:hypothetical protein EYF80_025514 [Liparis tanakae]
MNNTADSWKITKRHGDNGREHAHFLSIVSLALHFSLARPAKRTRKGEGREQLPAERRTVWAERQAHLPLVIGSRLQGHGARQGVVHFGQSGLVALRVDLDVRDPDVLPEAQAHHVQVVGAVPEGARQLHKHCRHLGTDKCGAALAPRARIERLARVREQHLFPTNVPEIPPEDSPVTFETLKTLRQSHDNKLMSNV